MRFEWELFVVLSVFVLAGATVMEIKKVDEGNQPVVSTVMPVVLHQLGHLGQLVERPTREQSQQSKLHSKGYRKN